MKTFEDAKALCERERDPFYLDAFMIEGWLGGVVVDAAAEYAEKKNGKDREMQKGQAWRGFLEYFGHAKVSEFPHVFQSLYRFAEYDDLQAEMLCRTVIPLAYENQRFSDLIGPNMMAVQKKPGELGRLMRRSMERWCQWLDALVHFQTHAAWHLQPVNFDPDPEKRELAVLGLNQRNFAELSDFGKTWWEWHHGEASIRFKDSPKWQMVGKAMASDAERTWLRPDVDIIIIRIWPLVKRHNWTYRDLRAVARQILPKEERYPLQTEQELATYCQNVLGLRKSGPSGRSSRDGKPRGWEVALKLCSRGGKSS